MPVSQKRNLERITKVLGAWETLRPTKTFAGMTLKQFKDSLKPSLESRETLQAMENQFIAVQTQREEADKAANDLLNRVVHSVKADAAEGDNGELYQAMGYVRRSERKSGLKRPRKPVDPVG